MSRFDYVEYDKVATALQKDFKALVQQVEHCIIYCVNADEVVKTLGEKVQKLADTGRPVALALNKLRALNDELSSTEYNDDDAVDLVEEFYMWVGKAIRDDQIKRNGSAPLQEGRKNG